MMFSFFYSSCETVALSSLASGTDDDSTERRSYNSESSNRFSIISKKV